MTDGYARADKTPTSRSFLLLQRADLVRLRDLAVTDRQQFFEANPAWSMYRDRVICTALCQGAALHYVTGTTGINDFDVYTFFAADPERRWYAKRIKAVDFGSPKFGTSEVSPEGFVGRRVDLMARSLDVPVGADPVQALHGYLRTRQTTTAKFLAAKAVVLLEPAHLLGTVAWPEKGCRPS